MSRRSRKFARESAPPGSPPQRSGVRWSPGAWWPLASGLLFLLALVWRVDFLHRLAATPLGGSLAQDAQTYWDWSGFLRAHGLLGTNPFFLGPLYPYVLAGLRALVGDSVSGVLVVQALWGSLAVVLLADAARRLTCAGIGLAVGLFMALYEMSVFFDSLVLMESLLFFLASLLLWLVVRVQWPPAGSGRLALFGALVGLMAEGRATAALLLMPLALAALGGRGRRWRSRLAAVAALAGGFALATLPVAVRNRVVSGEWIPFTYNLGYNLCVGNNPGATGGFVWITGTHQPDPADPQRLDGGVELDGRGYLLETTGRSLGPSASSAYWSAQAVKFVTDHPARAAQLTLAKLVMLWNRREYPQIENVDEFRAVAGPPGLPLLGTFALLGPLGLAGAWFAWRRQRPAERLLVGYLVVTTLGIVPFFVTDRYRHALVPALALLAALAVQAALAGARGRPAALRGPVVAALLAGFALTWMPAPGLTRARLAWGTAADLGARLAEQGDYRAAAAQFERAIRLQRAERQSGGGTVSTALERAALDAGYAYALRQLGRADEALPWLEQAAGLAPDDADIAAQLAGAYLRAGRREAAEAVQARMLRQVGGGSRLLASRGWEAARGGRFAQAESLFARAVAMEPGLSEAWGALIRLQVQQGELQAARASLARAGEGGLTESALHAHEALVFAASGDRAAAEAALARVSAEAEAADPTLADAVRVTRQFLARGRY